MHDGHADTVAEEETATRSTCTRFLPAWGSGTRWKKRCGWPSASSVDASFQCSSGTPWAARKAGQSGSRRAAPAPRSRVGQRLGPEPHEGGRVDGVGHDLDGSSRPVHPSSLPGGPEPARRPGAAPRRRRPGWWRHTWCRATPTGRPHRARGATRAASPARRRGRRAPPHHAAGEGTRRPWSIVAAPAAERHTLPTATAAADQRGGCSTSWMTSLWRRNRGVNGGSKRANL
ncbi:hypothetical protein C8E84_0069 [Ornithinibacter aureus]|nr:hypothetical protein C8E84_0069 [Ornithinibacter aureus]